MFDLSHQDLSHLLVTYGYGAILLVVALESMGAPLPGETMLIGASVYASTTDELQIVGIVVAAAAGAVLGDNLGYLVGRTGGYRLLRRYGRYVRLDAGKLRLGECLFERHGAKIVFIGRFIGVLRMWAALLAGVYRMSWRHFLSYNAAGAVTWAAVMGVGAYLIGGAVARIGGPAGIATTALTFAAMSAVIVAMHRNQHRWEREAEARMVESGAVALCR